MIKKYALFIKILPLKLAFISFILGASTLASAQEIEETFAVGIQIRPRAEIRNGQGTLISEKQDPAFFISNRARIKALFSTKRISIGVAGQSVGTWGQQPQIELQGGFMLNEAWAKIILNQKWNITIGRQAMVYDNDRILGSLDWHASGRFHDLALVKYETKKFNMHLGAAYGANGETRTRAYYSPTGQPYQHLEIAWFSYQISEALKATALLLNTGFQSGRDSLPTTWKISNMQTLGANLFYQKNKLQLHALAYAQIGQDASERDVNALLASLSGSFQATSTISIFAGADYLSGNDMNGTSKTQAAFNPLYGTNHKFYGYQDYFYVGNHIGSVGLIDINGGITVRASQKLGLRGAVHVFNAAAIVVDAAKQTQSSYLGSELDLTFDYKIFKGVGLQGGYSQVFAAKSMEIIKSVNSPRNIQNWVWLMLNVDLNVFSTTK